MLLPSVAMPRPLLFAFVLLVGCYGSPTLEGVQTEPEAASDPEATTPMSTENRGGAPVIGEPSATAQGDRSAELAGVLERLESIDPSTPKNERPGEGLWRTAELEKLAELVGAACGVGAGACRAMLEPIAAAHLPADEIWPLYSLFLSDLRPRGEEGAATLGKELLLRPEAVVRDRAYRLAVGAGAAVRGQPDEEGRRASILPTHPGLGEPVLFVIEQPAACNTLTAGLKGPADSSGRLDVEFAVDCPDMEPLEPEGGMTPRAPRIVWAFDAGPLPASGFALWMAGADEPILAVAPSAPAKK